MGRYTDNLSRRFRVTRNERSRPLASERLIAAAIRRDGVVYTSGGGSRTHATVRRSLGDTDPYLSKRGDQEGFFTSTGRFVDRSTARMIAIDAGQIPASFNRELLSSDVKW